MNGRPGTPLSPREREVIRLRAEGLQHKEVAHRLGISEHSVKNHITSIYQRLGAKTLIEALRILKERGDK